MVNKKEVIKEQHQVSVGPTMKKVLDLQKKNIREVTREVCESSNWEASEIIAKKVLENNLV